MQLCMVPYTNQPTQTQHKDKIIANKEQNERWLFMQNFELMWLPLDRQYVAVKVQVPG
jgi:hypothetical protein